MGLVCGLLVLGIGPAVTAARAATYFVDNRMGDNSFDGSTPEPTDTRTGPMRTIAHALKRARGGDTIMIANRGFPYYESISLTGARIGASGAGTLQIFGNGATLTGARPVPPQSWTEVGRELWKFTPWRKGHYRLLLKEEPVPEAPAAKDWTALQALPPGQWAVFEGSIYYRPVDVQLPPTLPFSYAADDVGLTLYNVRNVVVHDLTFRHFRLDGVSAPDNCRDVLLLGVRSLENGRAGLAVGGSSQVVMQGGELERNRVTNILVTGRATAEFEDTHLGDAAPDPEMPAPEPAEPAAEAAGVQP
jgi:hypothetical protein